MTKSYIGLIAVFIFGCSNDECEAWQNYWPNTESNIIQGSLNEWKFATGVEPKFCTIKKLDYSTINKNYLSGFEPKNKIINLYTSKISDFAMEHNLEYLEVFNNAIMHEFGHTYSLKHNEFPNLMSHAKNGHLTNLCISEYDLNLVCSAGNCRKFNPTCQN